HQLRIGLQEPGDQAADHGAVVDDEYADRPGAGRRRRYIRTGEDHRSPTWENFAWMMSLSNGFMMYSLAPAWIASWMWLMSFSVVQNTTTGLAPPSILRSARRKSIPFMTGMFQSSRIASGILARHASIAFCPSAASAIAKESPSRMRRATMRMTFESS